MRLLVRGGPHPAPAAFLLELVPGPHHQKQESQNGVSPQEHHPARGPRGGRRCGRSRRRAARRNGEPKTTAAKRKRAHTPSAMEREVERRGVGDPHKHSLERYLKAGWPRSPNAASSARPRWRLTASTSPGPSAYRAYPAGKLVPGRSRRPLWHLLQRGGVAHKAKADGSRDSRPLSPRTVLHVHRVLHTALEQARKWKLISENPARDAKAPTPRRISPQGVHRGRGRPAARRPPEIARPTPYFRPCSSPAFGDRSCSVWRWTRSTSTPER